MGELESLQAVSALSFLADDVEDSVADLCTLSVVALGPVVAGTRLTTDEVVRPEHVADRSRADGVQSTRLKINKNRAGNVASVGGLVKVNADMIQFKLGVAANVLSI